MSIRNSSSPPRHSVGDQDDIFEEGYHEQQKRLDFLRLEEQYEDGTDPWPLQLTIFDAFYIANDFVQIIIRQSAETVIENQIQLLIPHLIWEWFDVIQTEVFNIDDLQSDNQFTELVNQGLIDEPEPFLNHHDHWQAYNVTVGHKLNNKLSQRQQDTIDIPDNVSLASCKSINVRQLGSSTPNNPFFSKTSKFNKDDKQHLKTEIAINIHKEGEQIDFTIPHVEDNLENGMRMAYERDQQLMNLKDRNDKQRQTEQKLYQSQIAKLHKDQGRTKYTFDYEGKIMLQGQPKYEKLPTTYQNLNYDVIHGKVEYAELIQAKVKPQKTIQMAKQAKEIGQTNNKERPNFTNPSNQSITEVIALQKGVSYFDGNIRKSGPALHNETFSLMDVGQISQNLYNPNLGLKLTKADYQAIISNKNQNNSMSTLAQTFTSKKQIENESIVNIQRNDSFNLSLMQQSSILQQAISKNQNTSMISTSRLNQTGQIKVNGVSQLVLEDVYSFDQDSILEKELKSYQRKQLPSLMPRSSQVITSPTEQFHMDILSNREWGKNIDLKRTTSTLILPKTKSSPQGLPLIQKNPRDRLSIVAKSNIEKSTKLPPPNVGNVVGHSYRGYKIGEM